MSIQQLMYQYQPPPQKKTHKKLIKEKKLYGKMRETVLSSFHMLKLVFRNTIIIGPSISYQGLPFSLRVLSFYLIASF